MHINTDLSDATHMSEHSDVGVPRGERVQERHRLCRQHRLRHALYSRQLVQQHRAPWWLEEAMQWLKRQQHLVEMQQALFEDLWLV